MEGWGGLPKLKYVEDQADPRKVAKWVEDGISDL